MRAFLFTLIFISLLLQPNPIIAQNNAGKFGLEIVNPKIGLNIGGFRGRTPETNGFFNQGVSGFGQIYFPFQMAIDYRKNFTDSASETNEYNNRIFLIRSSALFHVIDNGSYAFGLAIQFSWLLFNELYIEYQLSPIYLEATKKSAPDLNSGFNLHHFVSLSKPLTNYLSLSLGIVHISNAGLSNQKGSNHDLMSIGFKFNF